LAHFADELPRHGIGFQPTDRAGRTDTLEQRHVFAESGDIHDPGFALSHVSLRRALAWIADRASAVTRDPKVAGLEASIMDRSPWSQPVFGRGSYPTIVCLTSLPVVARPVSGWWS